MTTTVEIDIQMTRFVRCMASLLSVAALTGVLAHDTAAQVRASERGGTSQTVDGTAITVEFGRPNTRGRENLFGGVVPFGKIWTPGANWATTIEVNKAITINGHDMPAGKYSVWLQVQPETWTAIFDPQPRRFHLMPPGESPDQVRFAIQPSTGSSTHMLTWSFPDVRATGATLELAWGTARIEFDIDVQPSHPATVAPEVAERYVGMWRLTQSAPLTAGEVSFEIRYENERLVVSWESAPNPLLANPWLIPLGAGMFAPAELENGEIHDIVMDLVFEFTPLDGRADRFEIRALDDQLWGTAVRAR